MTLCNRCGAPMVPTEDAVVPALQCTNETCFRMIPLPGSKARYQPQRGELKRAMRAHQRRMISRGNAAERH